jgi:hypothetical protein
MVTGGEVQSALAHCEEALSSAKESELRSVEGWALHVMGLIQQELGA